VTKLRDVVLDDIGFEEIIEAYDVTACAAAVLAEWTEKTAIAIAVTRMKTVDNFMVRSSGL
jgi:hypothetical protein